VESLQRKLAGTLSENGVLKEQINNKQSPADQANKELESADAEIVNLKSKIEEAEVQVELKEAEN